MKLIIYILSSHIFFVLQGIKYSHLDTINDQNIHKPTLLGKDYKDDFKYWKVIKKSSIKYDEADLSYRISIKSSEMPKYNRIVYRNSKSEHKLPSFYKVKKTDTIIANHLTFPNMYKFIGEEVIEQAKQYNTNFLPISEKAKRKKGWDFLKFNRNKVCLIKIKMSIGFYNKNTHSMKLIGDYDDEIIVYYITW